MQYIDLPILFDSTKLTDTDCKLMELGLPITSNVVKPHAEYMRFYNIDAISPYTYDRSNSIVIVGGLTYIVDETYDRLKELTKQWQQI